VYIADNYTELAVYIRALEHDSRRRSSAAAAEQLMLLQMMITMMMEAT